ncbi:DnaJ domain-containing protein [Sneathiella sp.]|uniref:DnaJ domain-containing protein n=1 Tax=Sneathiella sp. TaxID=1964365 RepID=UPI003562273D
MLAYFIIGAALLLALVIGGQSLAGADPKKLVKALRITAVVLLGAAAAFFALTGRFVFAPPLALAALFFFRDKPFFGGSRPSQGQKSDVKTNWLRATLNHDTGDMDGEILQGRFAGEKLSALSLQQLLDFRREAAADEQTVAILNTFLERNFSEDPAFEEGAGTGSKEQETRARATDGPMSRQEAFNILELESDATTEEIKKAHRRLMKKFHPDHNGSDYMAAKLNEAKDFLLKT